MKVCSFCGSCFDDQPSECPEKDGGRLHSVFEGPPVLGDMYRLERRLSRGGMGLVFKARHIALDKIFALKIILPDKSDDRNFLQRFEREARALGKLTHPNIIEVTHFGIDVRGTGIPYLVMELIAGQTLAEVLARQKSLTLREALPIFSAIAAGLDYAHACGIIHRDIKPQNILIPQSEQPEVAMLIDFGIARMRDEERPDPAAEIAPDIPRTTLPVCSVNDAEERETGASSPHTGSMTIDPAHFGGDSAAGQIKIVESIGQENFLTQPGQILGTLHYISPELSKNARNLSPASDIYAFGILIYEVLVGYCPFQGTLDQIIWGHRRDTPTAPSTLCDGLPPHIDDIVLSALAKDPLKRPQSATILVQRLEEAEQEYIDEERRRKRNRAKIILFLLVSCLAAVVLYPLGKVPFIVFAENKMVDLLAFVQARQPLNQRLLLLSVPEEFFAKDKGDELSSVLLRLCRVGAAGIALDILLPAEWGRSPEFIKLVLSYPTKLTLAALSRDNNVMGTECVKDLITMELGAEEAGNLFGFVNLNDDGDGFVRTCRLAYNDVQGTIRPSFAGKAFSIIQGLKIPSLPTRASVRINYRIDWLSNRIFWADALDRLQSRPTSFQNTFIVVGGEFSDYEDYHRIPSQPSGSGEVPGFVIQGLIINTLMENNAYQEIHSLVFMLVFLFFQMALMAILLFVRKILLLLSLLCSVLLIYVGLVIAAFWGGHLIIPIIAPLALFFLTASFILIKDRGFPSYPHHI